jgi:hypothetical protein
MTRKNKNDPVLLDLVQRIAKVEERTNSMEKMVNDLHYRIESVDQRVWAILSGVVISILLQILLRLV